MQGSFEEVSSNVVADTIDNAIAVIVVTEESVLIDLRKVALGDLPLIYFRVASTFMDVFARISNEERKDYN